VVIKKKDQTPNGYQADLVLNIHTCDFEKIKDLILVYNYGSQFLGEKNQIAIKPPVHCQFSHENHPFFKVFLK
jgi:hypothetical protein